MRIYMATVGSRGDVQPFVALGKGLQSAGCQVTLCAGERFEPLIVEHGLRYSYMNDELLRLMNTDLGREAMEQSGKPWEAFKTYRQLARRAGPLQASMLEETWQGAREARPDLVLFHPKAFGGPHFAEILGIPAMLVLLFPLLVPTADRPNFGLPQWSLGPTYNRFTYRAIAKLTSLTIGKYVKPWRRKQGLVPRKPGDQLLTDGQGRPIPVLHAYSRHVIPEPNDWPPSATVTGYWFLDQEDRWNPPADLATFIHAGEPPVYVGFGSMSGRRSRQLAEIVVEALQRVGVRGVLASGWGGLDIGDFPESVFRLDQAPHDWLFPKVSAVVHHGGAGTTAAGLRAGRPTVICPFFGDQPAWGRRVAKLNAGPAPIPQRRLTADRLAKPINQAVTDRTMRRSAENLGRLIRSEDGVANAVERIKRYCANPG